MDTQSKILVIDDDLLIRKTCRMVLEKKGFVVIEADNGATGLELFREHKPDVTLTDLVMPGKSGLETIAEILEIDPDAKIVAMSGGGSGENERDMMEQAKEAGAMQTVPKPFTPPDLMTAIEAA